MNKSVQMLVVVFLFVMCGASAYAGLPDLAVSDMVMTSEGKLDIMLVNVGDDWPSQNFVFNVNIQASKDGKGAGGWSQPIVQAPEIGPHGGTLLFHFFPLTIDGTVMVQVDVDHNRTIVEANEDNNRMIRTFTFGGEVPGNEPQDSLSRIRSEKKPRASKYSRSSLKQRKAVRKY